MASPSPSVALTWRVLPSVSYDHCSARYYPQMHTCVIVAQDRGIVMKCFHRVEYNRDRTDPVRYALTSMVTENDKCTRKREQASPRVSESTEANHTPSKRNGNNRITDTIDETTARRGHFLYERLPAGQTRSDVCGNAIAKYTYRPFHFS